MGEGRYQIAAKLQRQSSQIMEDILGYHHPYTVNVKGNLGISCRRNGEMVVGNTLLREASEFLAANQYPDNHPWVIKFKKEADTNGSFGASSNDINGSMSANRLPVGNSTRSLESKDSLGLRPVILTSNVDASSMKEVCVPQ